MFLLILISKRFDWRRINMNESKQKHFIKKAKLSSCGKPQSRLANECIALDCEMVGIGIGGKKHMLARVSIVNKVGDILMDKFVKPQRPVSVIWFHPHARFPDKCLNVISIFSCNRLICNFKFSFGELTTRSYH